MSRSLIAEVSVESAEAEGELQRLRQQHGGLVVQMACLKISPSARVVRMIAEQTLRARRSGALLASKPEVDLLLRLAGTSQISEAIERTGHQALGKRILVAAGPAEDVDELRRLLAKDKRYRLIEGEALGAEGLMMVEKAALLGTRL